MQGAWLGKEFQDGPEQRRHEHEPRYAERSEVCEQELGVGARGCGKDDQRDTLAQRPKELEHVVHKGKRSLDAADLLVAA